MMLRDRLNSNRRISQCDFSVFVTLMATIATPLIWGIPLAYPGQKAAINLPQTANAIEFRGARREDALQVAIIRNGTVFFDGQKIYPDDLAAKLREGLRAGAPRKVYVRADARVRYRFVMDVIDSIRSVGLSDVAFITAN
ncbi:MAG TPA: biopolymer transporter ExbD [Alphaproteobacteria bacterium]|nr:biopolymer transporter ExbD [Alphaproteobacteria bacterium]